MTLRGSTRDFPLESVIGLLAGTSKTGELQVRGGDKVGALGFASGRLVAAVMDGEGGESALGAIFAVSEADFEFTPWASAPEANLEGGDLVSVLKRAAEARDRLVAIRESIPDDRTRFKLSEKAADQGAVTFTPDRWRALLAVNGERDVTGIAEQLRLGKMQTLTLLAGLVKDAVIETLPPAQTTRSTETRESAQMPEPAPAIEPPPAEPPPAEPPPAEPTAEAAAPVSEPEPATPPDMWSAAESAPARDSGGAPAWEAPEPAAEAPPSAPAPESSTPLEPPIAEPPPTPKREPRADLEAELAERLTGFGPPAREKPPAPAEVPSAVDDRLSSLSSLFAPGPAANAPAQSEKSQDATRQGVTPPPPGRSADSWMPPPPAASETPANTWAPSAGGGAPGGVGAPGREASANTDPWGNPIASASPQATPPPAPARRDEWQPAPQAATPRATEAAPPPPAPPPGEAPAEKKRGGLFSMFRREEPASAPITRINPPTVAGRSGLLASLSNALLTEYNSGAYGKPKIDAKLANLLMRVDEQADPIDRPLPIVDDLIDAAALEREGFAEDQIAPYLATLVREIYEEGERAFGKDRAKKGYKAAQQQVFGGDASALQSPDLAGKLPKV